MNPVGPPPRRWAMAHPFSVLVFLGVSLVCLTGSGGPDQDASRSGGAVRAGAAATSDAPPPDGIRGAVLDATNGGPLAGASVLASGSETVTDARGHFSLPGVEPGTSLLVRLPGYERLVTVAAAGEVTLRLRPQVVKAAYLTYYGVNDREIRGRVLDLIETTELNGVVIDVKGDRGLIPYRTVVPLALEAGAQGPVIIKDMSGMVAGLKARQIYTIARIDVFKDTVLAHHRPDLAIIDVRTGRPWTDAEGLAWVDPFREEAWEYAIAVAQEAAAKGFDEIQFDYARFPSDGQLAAARYARENTSPNRVAAITGFLARARQALSPTGVYLAADLFGYTAFNTNDTDVGQRLEELAPHLDYISLMAYPSGYHLGIPRFRIPVDHPYEVVHESVRLTRQRTAQHRVRVRPWIQDFRDYAFDRRPFGVPEVQAQIRAAEDAGAAGWMLWNPMNRYTAGALRADPDGLNRPVGAPR